jgi:predicted nuclease of restriction endonuclease-like (RecB) superfamily
MNKKAMHQQFAEILARIQTAKQQSFQQANKTLVQLYWNIGCYISQQTKSAKWGKGTVEQLSAFIQQNEPNTRGFTARNIWRKKQFYETYANNPKLSPLVTELTWTNNLLILSSTKYEEERAFYLYTAIKEGYSKRELERQIDSGLFERTVLADRNLSQTIKTLPQNTEKVFKDSYVLEFLQIPKKHTETELQQAIISSLKDFILELGRDFCFLGQEYKVQVGNIDFSIDLLFYHRTLQCLVAIELKTDKFKPSYLGQLEFYLEALDQDVKKPHENPSIGVLLCRKKNDEVVKYALRRSLSPTVIADYETQLIPKELLLKKLNEFYALLESE